MLQSPDVLQPSAHNLSLHELDVLGWHVHRTTLKVSRCQPHPHPTEQAAAADIASILHLVEVVAIELVRVATRVIETVNSADIVMVVTDPEVALVAGS